MILALYITLTSFLLCFFLYVNECFLFLMALQHYNTLNVILFFKQNILYARTICFSQNVIFIENYDTRSFKVTLKHLET